jgi:hypothetical protein
MATVTATVSINLEIEVNDTWGDQCSVAQVKKQSMESANGMLSKLLEGHRNINMKGSVECVAIKYLPDRSA